MPPRCPACHQRRVRHLSAWIATSVCHEVPHRQFVFTIPRVLRGIFRKRRDLLHLLFQTATILRFSAGSYEWQAIEQGRNAKNTLRSLWRRRATDSSISPTVASVPSPPSTPSEMKITWKPETQTVIYRSKPHHNTKRNFEIFKAVDFIAALVDH